MSVRVLACIAISTISLLMSACSPMNSEFSCNATASDSCMTIEQVDAMTRFADGNSTQGSPRTRQRSGGRYEAVKPHGANIWVSQHPMK